MNDMAAVSALDTSSLTPPSLSHEETLVADPRGSLSPAQQVEHKLVRMLGTGAMPISALQTSRFLRR